MIAHMSANGAQDPDQSNIYIYLNVAEFPIPILFNALKDISDPSHIFYGSEWPFKPDGAAFDLANEFVDYTTEDVRFMK